MQKIPKFVFIEIPDGKLILHTLQPYLIGRVWKFKDLELLTAKIKEIDPIAFSIISGYKIAITLYDMLRGSEIKRNYQTEANLIMKEMGEFYLEVMISKSEKYYSKFKD